MSGLPSGTVSLLFSDIEGSTLLLNRLGPSYVDALDGQREVLRKAFAAFGGTEVGTEGDSLFVVFGTAADAVMAAAQAQREMAEYPWPGGERVRVRIGIHTGSPQVHDGDYVGIDVHRAARIAASAHGGQVVVSSVTADLARADLPATVRLRDLGRHQLKDITLPEHLFQLAVDGLRADFPALKTIGTASSLPVPTTDLVGRDGEVAKVTELLGAPGTRLATLTGPGGAGKTRLAIAVAQQLVHLFPDGVYFVPLASVTSSDVMWTSIAEVLDLPHQDRTPPGLLNHLAPCSALLILDNLEQLSHAETVVVELLTAAPHVVVIATSRRALGLPAEHRHRVPPLALPEHSSLADAHGSGAVSLFVQRAVKVRPEFALTAENVGAVVAICRRLDGLPLAIELCAARIRLLSPKALLNRLNEALDIASTNKQGPGRQRTLRDTIAWSHDLLTQQQQAFFRRLGVVAGGGDLDAVTAVARVPTDSLGGGDVLDMVADLVDSSLISITEGPDGEPRVAMLETIRAFAEDRLHAAGEDDAVRSAHASHYLKVADRLQALRESQHLVARGQAETELDNFRGALGWTLRSPGAASAMRNESQIGLRLCAALGWLWLIGGHLAEGRRWYERALERSDGSPAPELAACLTGFANLMIAQGDSERAREVAAESLAMARTGGDEDGVGFALGVLGTAQLHLGEVGAARQTFEEAVALNRRSGNRPRLVTSLGNLAGVEEALGHFARAEALNRESLMISEDLGDMYQVAVQGQNLAYLLAITDRADEANRLAQGLAETVLKLASPTLTIAFANTCMSILLRLGDLVRAAHLLGAEEAMRERTATPNPHEQEELEEVATLVHGQITAEEWDHHRELGRSETLEDLLAQFRSG